MKVQLISIGNELLIGQVINTNASRLGEYLSSIGWEIEKVHVIGDDHEGIIQCLREAYSSVDYVLTTGGLGPTRDDVSKKAIADYFKRQMVFHTPTWDRISSWFRERNYPISPLHEAQCYMPEGAEILQNDLGTAPGLWLQQGNKHCIVMPGVPYEMQHIMERHICPRLSANNGEEFFRQITYHCAGVGESVIADHIASWEDKLDENAGIAYLPSLGKVRIRFSMRNTSADIFNYKSAELKELLSRWYYGEGNTSLPEEIQKLMIEKGLWLVIAESCTGGNLAAQIVKVPGASQYFAGGTVTYTNELKQRVLGVSAETLEAHGAVSEPVVREMVQGALDRLGGDIAVAISGIAGPDGGTEDKPVGTVWIAVGNKDLIKTQMISFNKDRSRNIEFSTTIALNLVLKFLIAVYLK